MKDMNATAGQDLAGSGGISVREVALKAKKASESLALVSGEARNGALRAMAAALREDAAAILAENEKDMACQRKAGMKESLLDRLLLTEERIEAIAGALEDLVALDDPVGIVQQHRELYNGMDLKRVSVPLGVVAMVYEARPNVTADAAGICLKSGNACVLRGGSAALYSNRAIARILHAAAVEAGMPENCICSLSTTDRRATDELISLHGIVDVLIPRGGEGLIRYCVENAKVPVIETGTGNCHVYVHESADLEKARAIAVNAKCRRYGVCNAAESLLVDAAVAETFLPLVMKEFEPQQVLAHCDDTALRIVQGCGYPFVQAATEQDWATEYQAPEIAIRCVSGVDAAIEHINTYGTKHSEAIVAEDDAACARFAAAVDAACVYINASTAFSDGGEFGMGAEIGISTQKLHARGPFALEALTSYKYILHGDGQVRA